MTTFLTVALILMQSVALPASRGTLTLDARVRDEAGAAMPGVIVTVIREGNKLPRLAVTDESGRYVFSELRPGNYELAAELPGYRREPKGFTLTESATLDLTLRIGAICTFALPGCSGGGISSVADIPQPALDPRVVQARKDAERAVATLWRFKLRIDDLERSGPRNTESDQVIRGFYSRGRDAVPALILALQDEDVQVRRNAAVILAYFAAPLDRPEGAIDIREALPTLRERLRDADAEVREVTQRVIRSVEGIR